MQLVVLRLCLSPVGPELESTREDGPVSSPRLPASFAAVRAAAQRSLFIGQLYHVLFIAAARLTMHEIMKGRWAT